MTNAELAAVLGCLALSLFINAALYLKLLFERDERLADQIALEAYRSNCRKQTDNINQLIKTRAFFKE